METIEQSEGSSRCLEIVVEEIESARKDRRPMSRQALAALVHRRTGMPLKEATVIVETFCEEKEPALPEYLQSEFAIGWLKVVAVGNVIVGGVFYFYANRAHEQHLPYWFFLAIGTVFVGLGVLSWVKSLESEAKQSKD